jgi:hypothetical protein
MTQGGYQGVLIRRQDGQQPRHLAADAERHAQAAQVSAVAAAADLSTAARISAANVAAGCAAAAAVLLRVTCAGAAAAQRAVTGRGRCGARVVPFLLRLHAQREAVQHLQDAGAPEPALLGIIVRHKAAQDLRPSTAQSCFSKPPWHKSLPPSMMPLAPCSTLRTRS